jgi:hypothetical protein
MPFPIFPEYDYWYWPDFFTKDEPGTFGVGKTEDFAVNVSAIVHTNVSNSDPLSLVVRTTWLNLPDTFGSASAGIAVLFGRHDGDGAFTGFDRGMACSVDPRWTRGENWLTTSRNDWAWAGFAQATHSTILHRRQPPNDYDGERFFLPVDDGSWRRVALSREWLEALTPEAPDKRTSTIGMVLEDQVPQLLNMDGYDRYFAPDAADLTPFVEHVVSAIVVDGIARVSTGIQPSVRKMREIFGYWLPEVLGRGDTIRLTPSEVVTTHMEMKTEVQGFAYMLTGAAAYFALAILGFHFLVVVFHVAYIWYCGFATSALGTITELIVLAANSHTKGGEARLRLPSTSSRPQRLRTYGSDATLSAVGNRGVNEGHAAGGRLGFTFGGPRTGEIESNVHYG